MKRPMLIGVLSLVHGEILAIYMPGLGLIAICMFLAMIIVVTYGIVKKKYMFILLYLAFFSAGYLNMSGQIDIRNQIEGINDGQYVEFEGTVITAEYGEYILELVVKTTDPEGSNDIKCYVTFDDWFDVKPGNKVVIQGVKRDFNRALNQGNFDEQDYFYAKGIVMKVSGTGCRIADARYDEFKYITGIFKEKCSLMLSEICTEKEAGIFMAMLYGDKDCLSQDVKTLYSDSGIAHILAISGVHISILGLGIYFFLNRLFSVKTASVISTSFMILYGIMTGGSVSSERAVIMFIISLLCKLIGDVYDLKSSISIAGIILLLQNPFYLYDSGFCLSFGAVIAIGFVLPEIIEYYRLNGRTKSRKIMSALVSGEVINVVNAPIISNIYYEIPLYSVFLNIIVVPLMSVVVMSGTVAVLLAFFNEKVGTFVLGSGVYVLRFFEALCRVMGKLPMNKVVTGHFEAWQIIFFYLAVFGFTYILYFFRTHKRQSNVFMVISGIFMAAILNLAIYVTFPEKETITFLNVGQGDSALYVNSNGSVFLFDGGSSNISNVGENNILPYLKYCGIKEIQWIILSHSDEDHINGISAIFDDGSICVKNLMVPYSDDGFRDIIDIAEAAGVEVVLADGSVRIRDRDMNIDVLNPIKAYENQYTSENESSIVAMIEDSGMSVLMTGDISSDVEQLLIAEGVLKDIDILKCPHHGSKYSNSEEFLRILSPEIAIISCSSTNIYGHPAPETIERLNKVGSKIMRTDQMGEIRITVDEYRNDWNVEGID